MTCNNGRLSSDSVNLGSNPSPPATRNADETGVSTRSEAPEISEPAEQTAHAGRTKVGTAPAETYRAAIARLNRTTDREIEKAWRCPKCGGLYLTHGFAPHGGSPICPGDVS